MLMRLAVLAAVVTLAGCSDLDHVTGVRYDCQTKVDTLINTPAYTELQSRSSCHLR